MESANLAWLPWALLLSALGAYATFRAYRAGDRPAVVRRLGWTILPWGIYFLGLMRPMVRVADALADWAARFVFNPMAWLGIALSIVSVLMIGGGAILRRRRGGEPSAPKAAKGEDQPRRAVPQKASSAPADDDLDDIEAILRKHGIE